MYTLAPSCHGKPVLFTWSAPSWSAASSLAGPVNTGASATRRLAGEGRGRGRPARRARGRGRVGGGAGRCGDVARGARGGGGGARVAALRRLLAEDGRRGERVAHEERV